MIQVKDLCKVFRTDEVETIALDKVSFEVNDGEFVAIMGPSGCGKSTLLNILGLLDNPTSGQYWLAGKEVAGLKENERTAIRKGQVGFVFQSFNLIDELNVEENIALPLAYLGIPKAERGGGDAPHEHRAPRQALSPSALGRSAAACGHSARRGVRTEDHSRR